MKKIIILIPVFNDWESLKKLLIEIEENVKNIQNIFVSTDSEEYKDLAIKYGVSVPFLRPKNISKDNSTDIEWFLNLFEEITKLNFNISDYWVWLRPTTPLREINVIEMKIVCA